MMDWLVNFFKDDPALIIIGGLGALWAIWKVLWPFSVGAYRATTKDAEFDYDDIQRSVIFPSYLISRLIVHTVKMLVYAIIAVAVFRSIKMDDYWLRIAIGTLFFGVTALSSFAYLSKTANLLRGVMQEAARRYDKLPRIDESK
jgi:hypothetical protein